MDEVQVIEDVLSGQSGRFSALVERYVPMVRAVCNSHVYDRSAHDDLVQDTFVESYRRLNTLRDHTRFGPWLATIARNKCKTWIRGTKRRERAYDRVSKETTATVEPLNDVQRRETRLWVREQIGELPLKTREAMLLCYVEGQSVSETAAFLGISENAVKQRLFYGRQRLGDSLCEKMRAESPPEDENGALQRRVMAIIPAIPMAPPTSGPSPVTIAAGFSGVLAVPVLAAAVAFGVFDVDAPARASASAAASAAAPQPAPIVEPAPAPAPETGEAVIEVFRVAEIFEAPAPNTPFRVAPFDFDREKFEEAMVVLGLDGPLVDVMELRLVAPQEYLDMEAGGAISDNLVATATMAMENVAAEIDILGADAMVQSYNTFMIPPAESAWVTYETGPDGRAALEDLPPGHYVLDSRPTDARNDGVLPWQDPHRTRFIIRAGDTTRLRHNIPVHPAEFLP